ILTTTMFPVMLSYMRIPHQDKINRLFNKKGFIGESQITKITKNHSILVMIVSGLVVIIAIIGLTRINTNIAIMDDLKKGNTLYDNFQFVEENFGGILPLEIVVDAQSENGILDPDFMKNVGVFQERMKDEVPAISSTISIYDHALMINEILGDGTQGIPDSKDELLSFFMDYEGVDDYVANNYTLARISTRMSSIESDDVDPIKGQINAIFNDVFKGKADITITGTTFLALKVGKHLVSSLTRSFS
ncbi:uncharacterized protein METZ01_LOCUS470156, partial [marine metagenome]